MDQPNPTEQPPLDSPAPAIDKSKAQSPALQELVSRTVVADASAASSPNERDAGAITPREIAFGFIVMLLWLGLLGVGTIYSSTAYGNLLVRLGWADDWKTIFSTAWYFLLFILTYTVTNTFVLCVLAAALGEAGRRDQIGDETKTVEIRPGLYFGAMVRGFMTYLFVISGSVVIANKSYDVPTRQDYLTFASTVSVLGFLAGYNPSVFVRFMNGLRLAVQAHEITTADQSKSGGVNPPSKNSNPAV